MSEPEVLLAARYLGKARRDWAQAYLMARLDPNNRSAKDAEAVADEEFTMAIHEADALYQIAKSRLGGTTDADTV